MPPSPGRSPRIAGLAGGLAAAGAIWALPGVAGISQQGQQALAILVLGVIFWAAEVLNSGVTALIVLALLLSVGVPANVALGGFSSSAWWILVSVLFIGTAMDRTGLARRAAYAILAVFRPTYGGILASFLVIGFVLMVGVPSMTVRTAIMVPIAWALVRALPLERPGRGAALITLTAFEMAVLPGVALLTGSLWGPFVAGLFASSGIELTWLGYARVMAVPTIAWSVLVVGANLLVLSPGRAELPHREILRAEMAKLGPMRRAEFITAAIVGLSILAWASQPWHLVPAEAIGMMALAALIVTRVLAPGDLGTGIPWPLLIFIGGILGATQTITAYEINDWFAAFIVPGLQPFMFHPLVFVLALGTVIAAVRIVEPSGFITIAAFFLALAGAATPLGASPLALAFAVLLPVHVFWFNHQNIWIVMTDGITGGEAYTPRDRFRFAALFFGATLAALALAVVYWRLLGVI